MELPIYERLTKYHRSNRISFAMPGHKNGRGLMPGLTDCDVTELDATENLHRPGAAVKRSQELIAQLYHSDKSYIMTGGSTAGIQAAISAAVDPGDTLLAFADCHMSVINTCALIGAGVRLMPLKYDAYGGYAGFDEELFSALLSECKAAIAVSPDYYGRVKDIERIAAICHAQDKPLLTDQAHGAHFAVGEPFPAAATELGSDCTVMSAHKTLNALNGAAYLHVNGTRIDRERLERALSMFQSSSPSYVIAASAETAALTLDKTAWQRTADICRSLKSALDLPHMKNDDPTRLVFYTDFADGGMSGFEAEELLADKFGIDIEMADMFSIVLIATPSNSEGDFETLYAALKTLGSGTPVSRQINIEPPIERFLPSEGYFCKTELLFPEEAVGKTAACSVMLYPPGIPIICCGAEITAAMAEEIGRMCACGGSITGMRDGKISVVKYNF